VERSEIIKTMTSSGTTGQAVSKIYLDRVTAANQTKVLVKIVSSFTGSKRLPLLIVDSPAVIKDRALFSARGAGILGFSMLGHDPTYLLDENYKIDFARLDVFLEKHRGSRILLFGFTFVIWEHLCQALVRAGRQLQMDGILIHGGQSHFQAGDRGDLRRVKRLQLLRNGRADRIDLHGMRAGRPARVDLFRRDRARSSYIFTAGTGPCGAIAVGLTVAGELSGAFDSD
jgi:hypothetical protein